VEIRAAQHSFAAGELGPYLAFRSDQQFYTFGVQTLANYLVAPQGAAIKRAGLRMVQQLTGFSSGSRCVLFKFSETQQYVLVLDDSKLRIFRNGAQVWDNVASAVTAPWTAAQVRKLRWVGSGDSVFVVSQDGTLQPQRITRNGADNSWSIAPMSFDSVPRANVNSGRTITPSAVSGSITLTASSSYWTSDHVNSTVEGNGGVAKITSISSGTVANATTSTAFASTAAIAANEWRITAWSAAYGWPRTITFHDNRLVFGGSRDLPQTIWGSRVADFFTFASTYPVPADGVPDDDPFAFTMGTDEVNTVVDLFSLRGLQVFTNSGEFIADANPITPGNINIRAQSRVGTSESGVRVTSVDYETLFVSRDGKQMRSFAYNYEQDQMTSANYTRTAHDILSAPQDLAFLRSYGQTQNNAVFVVRDDGQVACMNIEIGAKALGWSRIVTDGLFKSVAVADGALYAVIDRDGTISLESMSDTGVYLDAYATATSGSPQASWSGFATLAGMTVDVVGDGYHYPDVEVDGSGNFTLPEAVSSVQAGLPFASEIETLPIDFLINGMRNRGDRMRKLRAFVTVAGTKDLWVDGRDVPSRQLGVSLLDQAIPEHRQTVEIRLSGISASPTVTIESRRPFPQVILGLITEIKTRP
jgi:hypothetical protein